VVAQAVSAGVNLVQLRERDLPAGQLIDLGRALREALAGAARLIVNDRVDVAMALEADGVQLPESGLPVADARRLLGPDRLIGRSVHSLEGALAAARAGADYLIFGPVYATGSHPGAPPAGREALHDIAQAVSVPVLAIGGINAENARGLILAGAAGVAVVSNIMGAASPRAAAEELAGRLMA
jgi:thiamine-phosphate pyrophosphorylase